MNPGDCLLFSRKTIFDRVVSLKTWSSYTHVEIYIGNNKTVASRNGKGCAVYSQDLTGLGLILRPVKEVNIEKAMIWFWRYANGRPYGWIDLLRFVLINIPTKGLICSELATMWYRAGNFDPFSSSIFAGDIAPSDFRKSPNFIIV